jgi:hypothetical protein
MGTWGTGLFSDDEACDIRDAYRDQIEDGIEDAEALRSTLAKYRSYFDDLESGPICILALAVTQSKIGRLDPDIRTQALAAIDSGADLAIWEQENPKSLPKRRAVLEKVRAQLIGPQPARKRLRRPRKETCGLVAGDGLGLMTPSGLALLRVIRVRDWRLGETPILEEMQFRGSELPSQADLDQLKAVVKSKANPFHEPRFCVYSGSREWEQVGFRKLASFAPRPGDEQASPDTGLNWTGIAERLQGKRRSK